MTEKVAVIGMGQMGSGMARRLVASGYDVVGYDINTQTRQALRKEGLAVADTVAEALAGRSLVLSSLPDPVAIRAAWLGEGGLVDLAPKGTLLMELSTIDPKTMVEVGKAAAARGIDVIDCPVSGSPAEAAEGKLVLIVGGEEAAVKRAEPILLRLGQAWRHTGPVGTAKVVKLVNNMMAMGAVMVAAEAFTLGVAAGVQPEKLFEVLSVSGGRSHHFLKRFPNAIKGDFRPGFKMELGEKDMALAIDFGRSLGMPTPTASLVRELMATALAEGYRGQDIVAVQDMYGRWAKGGAKS
ncbi:MAG TPA: NAD(P)-dependent oxidoreductase [Hyphomicrobiaceae bacterium]|nr:NAD(P)-dependent oxidoreductase [Hyphomicrobiaceae bacterium]